MRLPVIDSFDAWMARHRLAYGALVLFAACLVCFLFVDQPLALYLHQGSWRLVDPAFRMIGQFGVANGYLIVGIPLYVAMLVAAARIERSRIADLPVAAWCRWVARHCLLLFASLAATAAVVHLIKNVLGRERPRLLYSEDFYGFDPWFGGDSFPSGHTQTAFAVAAVLALAFPRWRRPLFLLAGLVALSRLVNGAHYLSDTLAGAFISLASVLLLQRWLLDPARVWPGQPPWRWWRR